MARERLVVIGNGMVGLRFVEGIVARGADRYDLTVIGAEPVPAYNRVLLSAMLAGDASDDDCRLRDRRWYLANGIRLVTGQPATRIDTVERTVEIGRYGVVPYDRLVLATGSSPIRLAVPGMDLAGAVGFRDISDVATIRAAASEGRPAVVIGGGLLGLEAAYGLARLGVATTLVHLRDRVMERQLDHVAAGFVADAMRSLGITLVLAADTAAVEGTAQAEAVRLADGRRLAAGLVVVAVGVRPNTTLASSSGIATGRGILVDDTLTTSVPEVFAVGECAEHAGIVHGLVAPGHEQADVLARRFAGDAVTYRGSLVSTRLKVSGVPVFSAGTIEPVSGADEVVTLQDEAAGLYRKLVLRENRLIGAILVGDVSDASRYFELVTTGTDVGSVRDTLVFAPPVARDLLAEAA